MKERERWTTVLCVNLSAGWNEEHRNKGWIQLHAVVAAFEKAQRAVRIETASDAVVLRVRR